MTYCGAICAHPSCKPGATVQGVKERVWYCSRPLGHTGNHRHTNRQPWIAA